MMVVIELVIMTIIAVVIGLCDVWYMKSMDQDSKAAAFMVAFIVVVVGSLMLMQLTGIIDVSME